MAIKIEAATEIDIQSHEHWKTAVTETSMRLAMAALDKPQDRRRLTKIVMQSGLIAELAGFAHTLATNDHQYAGNSLKWAYEDFEIRGIYVNPLLLRTVRRRLK